MLYIVSDVGSTENMAHTNYKNLLTCNMAAPLTERRNNEE